MRKLKLVTIIITIAMFFFTIFDSTIQYSNAITFEKFGPECNNLGFNSGHNLVINQGNSDIKPPFIKKWKYSGTSTEDGHTLPLTIVSSENYIYAVDGDIGSVKLVSIDKKTGKKVSSTNITPFLLPTLAMTKDTVFFGNMNELTAYDASSLKMKWKYSYKIKEDDFFLSILFRAAPVTYKDKVIFHDYENLVCISSDNKVAWKTKCNPSLIFPPAVSDGKIFLNSPLDKSVNCYDFNTGKKIWTSATFETSPLTASVYEDKVFYLRDADPSDSDDDPETPDPSIIGCLSTSDGRVLWEYTTTDSSGLMNTVSDGKIVINTWDNKTTCLDINNGKKIWQIDTKDKMGEFPILLNNNTIICSSFDKNLYVIDLTNGNIISRSEIDFINLVSPIFDKKCLYLGSKEGSVMCLEQDTDIEPWNIKITPPSGRIKVDGQMHFNAVILNKNNNQVGGEVTWSVIPPDAGTISKTGLFKGTKPGKHKVIAKIKNITGEAEIIVENIPPVFNAKSLDFGEIDFGIETPKMTVEIKNNSKFPYEIKVTPSYSWIGIEKEKIIVEPGTTGTLTVFPIMEKMEPGKAYKGKILLDWGDNQSDIDFYIRIKRLAQLSMDSETTIKLHDLKINSITKKAILLKNENFVEFNCSIISEDSWLTFNSTEFKVAPKSEYLMEFSVSTAGMKNDEAKTGKFTMESNTGKLEFMVLIKPQMI